MPVLLTAAAFSILWSLSILFISWIILPSIPNNLLQISILIIFELIGSTILFIFIKKSQNNEGLALFALKFWLKLLVLFAILLLPMVLLTQAEVQKCEYNYQEQSMNAARSPISAYQCYKWISDITAIVLVIAILGPHNPIFLFLSGHISDRLRLR